MLMLEVAIYGILNNEMVMSYTGCVTGPEMMRLFACGSLTHHRASSRTAQKKLSFVPAAWSILVNIARTLYSLMQKTKDLQIENKTVSTIQIERTPVFLRIVNEEEELSHILRRESKLFYRLDTYQGVRQSGEQLVLEIGSKIRRFVLEDSRRHQRIF